MKRVEKEVAIDLLRSNTQAPEFDAWYRSYCSDEQTRLRQARVAEIIGDMNLADIDMNSTSI